MFYPFNHPKRTWCGTTPTHPYVETDMCGRKGKKRSFSIPPHPDKTSSSQTDHAPADILTDLAEVTDSSGTERREGKELVNRETNESSAKLTSAWGRGGTAPGAAKKPQANIQSR